MPGTIGVTCGGRLRSMFMSMLARQIWRSRQFTQITTALNPAIHATGSMTFMCKIWSISGPGGWLVHVGCEPKKPNATEGDGIVHGHGHCARRASALGQCVQGDDTRLWRKPHDSNQVDRTSGAMQGRGRGKAADEVGNTVEGVAMCAASSKRDLTGKNVIPTFLSCIDQLGVWACRFG